MKKVVIIGPAYPLRGGLATFNQRFAKELKLYQIDPIIYTFTLQYPSFFFPGKTQIDTDQPRNGVDIHAEINSINPLNWIKVAKEIASLQPDYIICRYWIPFFGPSLGSILRLIKKNCDAKIVALVDNLIPHERRFGDQLLTKYFVAPIDYFLVMSEKVKRDIEAFNIDKPIIRLMHPIFDNYGPKVSRADALEHLGLPEDMTYVLFFGFVRKYKGLDLLLNAMTNPILKNSNIKLIVAGEFYEKEGKYRNMIKLQKLSDKVIMYPDYVPNKEVKYYFSASDLVVLPYRSASQSGISQIAFHYAKPILITDVGGLPEIVDDGHNGFIVEARPDSIAAGMKQFLDRKDKCNLSKYILENNEKFSWSRFTQDLLSQLEVA